MIPSPFQVTLFILIIMLRLFVAAFKITGYIIVAGCEIAWYGAHARRDRIGEAIGRVGENTVDALAEIFSYK